MNRILVTGSEGAIGQYIVKAVAARWPGAEIVRVSRRWPSPGVVFGDLRERSFVQWLLQDRDHAPTDAIIHAAAAPYDPYLTASPFDLMSHDIRATATVLECAAEARVPHVTLLSSATVYEHAASPWVEEATCNAPAPSSPLALAKYVSEEMLRAWSKQTGGSHTIWRLFNVVTPLEPHDRPGHIQVDLYRKIIVERLTDLPIMDTKVRGFTWVEDIASAIAGYLDDPRALAQTFNLGTDVGSTAVEFALNLRGHGVRLGLVTRDWDADVRMVASTFYCSDRVAVFRAASESRHFPSTHKARTVLGWADATSYPECVRKFIEAKAKHEHEEGKHAE